MLLDDKICDKLAIAAHKKSKDIGIDISFAVTDEKGLLLYFKKFGDALPVSIGLVQKKAYTSSVLRMPSGDIAPEAVDGGSLFGIQNADPNLTVLPGGFPLFKNNEFYGAIAVGGGTTKEDAEIGNYVLKVFEEL